MKACLYCNTLKDPTEFSEEHVIPQAIGGALFPSNPFKTSDVCKKCNNTCGLFIDTAFIKSWTTQAGRTQNAHKHLNIETTPVLPLQYVGVLKNIAHGSCVCDLWLGPTGDSIFHFHEPYDEVADMPAIVGAAPNLRAQADLGFVFLFVAGTNPAWHPIILRSLVLQFKNSELYLGNGPTPEGGVFSEIPDSLKALHGEMIGIASKTSCVGSFAISPNFGSRFLAKLALGVGHLFLKEGFSSSTDAGALRSAMWERDSAKRQSILFRGHGFFGNQDPAIDKILNWDRGHILSLMPNESGVALHVRFYNSQTATVYPSLSLKHWPEDEGWKHGVVFLIAPSLRKFVGPISIPDFIAHRFEHMNHSELARLESEVDQRPPLPPFNLPPLEQPS